MPSGHYIFITRFFYGKFTNTNALKVTKEFDDVCVEVEMELKLLPPPLHEVSSSNIIKNTISLFFVIFLNFLTDTRKWGSTCNTQSGNLTANQKCIARINWQD